MESTQRQKPFTSYETTIEEGSLVLIYISQRHVYPMVAKRGALMHHMDGILHHDRMIGQQYGSTIYTHNQKGKAILLHPTCEKWTLSLPHRTQIIYAPDIAAICSLLDLQPGMRIVESGTGSASLTHSLARAVAPSGSVFTFEYHETRVQVARQEFIEHGLSDVVEITQANVYLDGFVPESGILDGTIHAIVLDLPEPWKAVPHTPKLFVKTRTGRICCFSPCIEQVEKTREALVSNGFTDIRMVECLQKKYESKQVEFPAIGARSKKRKSHELEQGGAPDLSFSVAYTPNETKGHSAYLTFASYLPDCVPQSVNREFQDVQDEELNDAKEDTMPVDKRATCHIAQNAFAPLTLDTDEIIYGGESGKFGVLDCNSGAATDVSQ